MGTGSLLLDEVLKLLYLLQLLLDASVLPILGHLDARLLKHVVLGSPLCNGSLFKSALLVQVSSAHCSATKLLQAWRGALEQSLAHRAVIPTG